MATVSTILSFVDQAEAAFKFYKSIFGGTFTILTRYSDFPQIAGQEMTKEEKNLIMHVELPILGGHVLMGADIPKSLKKKIIPGNNVYILLSPNTRAEAENLFKRLSYAGTVEMPMQHMLWGGYYGTLVDKFGIHWMINVSESPVK
jgi:PhnB protein